MSDALAKARAIAAAANEQRAGMDDAHRDYYVPVGMFVGEHTGFVVMPDVMVTAMLDAIEAAEAYVETPPPARTIGQAEDLCGLLDRVLDLIGDDDE